MSIDQDEPFDIVALGKKGERVFVQVKVSERIAKQDFKGDYYTRYDENLKLWSGDNHQLPPAIDSLTENKISKIASEKTDDLVLVNVNATYVEGNYVENIEGDFVYGNKINKSRNVNKQFHFIKHKIFVIQRFREIGVWGNCLNV